MTQRTTGATPEQIERAANEFWSHPREQNLILATKDWTELLVRPDERIVSVADLKRMAVLLRYDEYNAQHLSDDERDLSDRITALLGDDV